MPLKHISYKHDIFRAKIYFLCGSFPKGGMTPLNHFISQEIFFFTTFDFPLASLLFFCPSVNLFVWFLLYFVFSHSGSEDPRGRLPELRDSCAVMAHYKLFLSHGVTGSQFVLSPCEWTHIIDRKPSPKQL